ncbi:MAG: tRNA 5-methoxyuridine(34)/uridine 5-oxyacetic acid(34) synthase CmoB [Pseudomonadota bacterium]
MIDWNGLIADAAHAPDLQAWLSEQQTSGDCELSSTRYGDLPRWLRALDELPKAERKVVWLDQDAPRAELQLGDGDRDRLRSALQALHPWRKGPFDLDGVRVDAEWRSDFKWRRIEPHLAPLAGRSVLDVGCGNGYFCFRLLGAGARLVLGIDPSPLFNVQFAALKRLFGPCAAHLLPLADTALSTVPNRFDTVLSMGVLYHRKSPFDHLNYLHSALKPGGQLMIETLVTEGGAHHALVPSGRYARMRNVWFLPSVEAMQHWLRRAGFGDVACVDCCVTDVTEQRSTDWMRFESHAHALDPANAALTVEGLPAPTRAAFIATRPR